MFDIGFSELIVIAIVALVVIGPERLPKVARTAGLLLGRMQRYVNDVKADISREIHLDEIRKLQAEMQESAHDLERSISSERQSIEQRLGTALPPAAKPSVEASGHLLEDAPVQLADAASASEPARPPNNGQG